MIRVLPCINFIILIEVLERASDFVEYATLSAYNSLMTVTCDNYCYHFD